MKKIDGKKVAFTGVIIILCVFFLGGIAWGGMSLLEMEGTAEPSDLKEGITPCPESAQDALALLNTAVDKAIAEKPFLQSSNSIKIGETNGHDEENALALKLGDGSSLANKVAGYIKDAVSQSVENSFEEISASYGEGFENTLWRPDINVSEIKSFECKYIYYLCKQCSEDFNEQHDECPNCSNKEKLIMKYRDEYELIIYLNDEDGQGDNSPLKRNFRLRSDEDIKSLIGDSFDKYLTYSDLKITYSNIKITARIDRMTNKLYSLSYYKEADVNAQLEFIGEFSSIKDSDVFFTADEDVRFNFTWPGVKLSTNFLSMEQKKTEALKATLSCDDPLKYDVTWESSDPSVATVDSEGYVSSNKKDGKTVITATFEFLGETYKDECEIFVKTSVESIDISKRSLELKVSDTYTLTARVSPAKSTVKTVKWYSDNEDVATVDSNGCITAISPGSVNIFAVSDDGYYKATCKTEVTK